MKCWGKVILVALGFCLLLYSGIKCSAGKKKDPGRTDDWEALGRNLEASVVGVAGGLLGTGPQEREPLVDGPLTPHHVGAPSLVFWHASGGMLPWGHLLGFQNMGSPQI